MKGKSVIYTELFLQDATRLMQPEQVLHFVNFKYSFRSANQTIPIEMGISTHLISDWKEIGSFHRLISVDTSKIPKDSKIEEHHGIQFDDPRLCTDHNQIVEDFNNYIVSFKAPIIFVVKRKETHNPNVECLMFLLSQSHVQLPEYYFIRENMLIAFIAKHFDITLPLGPYSFLMSISNKIGSVQRCDLHKEMEGKSCAIDVARVGALSFYIILAHMNVILTNKEGLPKIELRENQKIKTKNEQKEDLKKDEERVKKSKDEILKDREDRKRKKEEERKQKAKLEILQEKNEKIDKTEKNEKSVKVEIEKPEILKDSRVAEILAKVDLKKEVLHFFDFEFSDGETSVVPVELGISSYRITENKEINYFHCLLSPPSLCENMDRAVTCHGIDYTSLLLEKNYKKIIERFEEYFSQFHQDYIILVLKDETIGGDFVCFEKIFEWAGETMNANFVFLTHEMLLREIGMLEGWKSTVVKEYDTLMNEVYKQLHVVERCQYHKCVADKYHCGLEDARHTALTVLIALNDLNFPVTGKENLPHCIVHKREVKNLDNWRVLITTCASTGNRMIVEVGFTEFFFQPQGEMVTGNSLFYRFQQTERILKKKDEPSDIIEKFNAFISQSDNTMIVLTSLGMMKKLEFLKLRQFPVLEMSEFMQLFVSRISPFKKSHGLLSKAKKQVIKTLKVGKCALHPSGIEECPFTTNTIVGYTLNFLNASLLKEKEEVLEV
ncbi:hypothetical protein EIN_096270 [Entamoeba invadens IP1]|uniref:Maelstrom domain-containing protein n=1 Tax=Entamoeba invadens IP1 TaxID=370355 RepID=A0A0A1U0F5_ENTIV|nr:hypothetical protein EIN_096270 [Entamoeba invadens IP1]ELP87370.1 hypothetical protein EIN_096270 [Entamoeba invadens IP1]|eukprot:XP_004254141.1 hypothetical protein EIN_096270 [Entamoeba invadens IP1]